MTSKIDAFFCVVGVVSATLDLVESGAGILEESGGIFPLPQFVSISECLIDEDLSVVGQADPHPLQRARRGAFEVDAVLGVARAVAGTLELVLRAQPARGAAEVRADAQQRVEPAV